MILEADMAVRRRSLMVEAAFSLAGGERLSIFGTSGAGKTTLLEAIAGTVPLVRGEVTIDGQTVNAAKVRRRDRSTATSSAVIPHRKRAIAVVRQPTTLFPHLCVSANVSYGIKADVTETLQLVGLAGLGAAMPGALSGGQRQRVAVGRALARPFRVLLLDEPFSAVDVTARPPLMKLAIQRTTELGAVGILVSHDLSEAQAFGHKIAVLDAGRVLQIGDAEKVVLEPASVRVAELCGYSTFLDHDDTHVWALHPDRFTIGEFPSDGYVIEGTVAAVRASGVRFACEVETTRQLSDGGPVVVSLRNDTPLVPGSLIKVTALSPPLVARVG